jgi:ATP-dependent protease ClpP protease subunit
MNKELDMVYVKPSPQNLAYFLDGDIGEPDQYRELVQLLTTMSEDDHLELTICSFGGYLHTTIMLSALIRNCRGHVHGILAGVAMSGGSILLLSCHSVEVMPHSQFMAHTSSGYDGGKLSDKFRSIQSGVKQLEALYKDVYSGFYTNEEIEDILAGKDSYLTYEEICERLDNRAKLFEQEAKAEVEKYQQALQSLESETENLNYEDLIKLPTKKAILEALGITPEDK